MKEKVKRILDASFASNGDSSDCPDSGERKFPNAFFCGKNPNDNSTVHKITNWTTKHPLFHTISAGGVVDNVIIDKSCNIYLNYAGTKYSHSGTIASYNYGTIQNVTNYGTGILTQFSGGS